MLGLGDHAEFAISRCFRVATSRQVNGVVCKSPGKDRQIEAPAKRSSEQPMYPDQWPARTGPEIANVPPGDFGRLLLHFGFFFGAVQEQPLCWVIHSNWRLSPLSLLECGTPPMSRNFL